MKKSTVVMVAVLRVSKLFCILVLLQSCGMHFEQQKYRYIDKTGREFITGPFVFVRDFSGGLACVKVGTKYGFIDHTGKFVIKPQFGISNDFSEGLARATNCGDYNYGFIDRGGKWIIPPQFIEADDFSEGLAWVGIATKLQDGSGNLWGRKSGYIDKSGRFVFAIKAENSSEASGLLAFAHSCKFVDGLAPFLKTPENRWGYIDKSGEFAIKPRFLEASCFVNGFAKVKMSEGVRLINRKGQLIGKVFLEARDFSDGMAAIQPGGEWGSKWGYADSAGQVVIKPQFDEVGDFSEGYAVVRTYVPREKTSASAPTWNLQFQRALGLGKSVKINNDKDQKTWVIDKMGENVNIDLGPEWPPDLNGEFFANHFSEGLLGARRGQLAGFVDKTGIMTVPAKWQCVGNFHEGLAHVLASDTSR